MKRKTQLLVLYKINLYCDAITVFSFLRYFQVKNRDVLMPPQQYVFQKPSL